MGFRNKFINFMYGRYGWDKLSWFLFALALVLTVVQMFVFNNIARFILNILYFGLVFLVCFRFFSKNRAKRYAENERFLKISSPVFKQCKLLFNRVRYYKNFRYRKCPHCKNTLKLRAVKGKHRAACPCCGESFDVKI